MSHLSFLSFLHPLLKMLSRDPDLPADFAAFSEMTSHSISGNCLRGDPGLKRCFVNRQKCMVEYFTKRYSDLAKQKLGTDILDTQLAYSIRFYCMGSVGMTQEWVLTDNITSAETVVRMMFQSMPQNLYSILQTKE